MGGLTGCGREACEGQIGAVTKAVWVALSPVGAIAGVVWVTLGVTGMVAGGAEAVWGLPG